VLVGFTLSEARNSAQLIIDGKIVADTGKGLGSFAKASKPAPVSEADISHRKYADTGGSLIYGAHMAQANDMPHVQSHVFYGFLGDMRLFHTAPENEAKLMKILRASAEELKAGLLPPYAISVRTSFELHDQAGQKALIHNLADSSPIVGEPTGSRHVDIKLFSEKPVHPFYRHVAGASQPAPPVDIPPVSLDPLPSLSPEALEKTWTKEWVARNGKAALHESQKKADIKAEQVRMAMAHTWRGYRAKAWGHDDLKPVSGNSKDWCKIGITLLDALTTLWLLDLKTEWDQAVEWLTDRPQPTPGTHGMHSTFEMSIRGLGGLLGAYALSKQQIFLDNARRLADALLHAFNTPSGMPRSQVDVGTGATKWHSWVHFAVLAEVTTVQVEMRYLSHLLGDDTYKRAADRAFDAVLAAAGTKGLVPIYLTQMDEVPRFGNKKISLGAMGDSYYEYLIKQWVQNGKTEDRLKNKWKDAMREMLDQLVRKTNGGLTYICEKDNNNLRHRMDHLACFVAGMLMMGARELPVEEVDPRWEPTATALTETCHEMYRRTPTGLSPEYVIFHPERSAGQDMQIPHDAPHNLLRPEAAEAMYYMHYYTGDPKYREWAGEMIDAFDRYSKAPWGYAAVRDVRAKPPIKRDDMESFWGAETLKYLYLIQAPRNKLSLEEFVFNTEAHPMTRWLGG
jgi:mannosyl-oligosaccharide alpha-1,2-mannosidase